MVYSILPPLARRERYDGLFGTSSEGSDEDAPKILTTRRFTQDWEIYINDEDGFELEESFDSESIVSKHGPSMAVIAACVKRCLQGKAFSS